LDEDFCIEMHWKWVKYKICTRFLEEVHKIINHALAIHQQQMSPRQ